jgi:hypothetical protein
MELWYLALAMFALGERVSDMFSIFVHSFVATYPLGHVGTSQH